MEPLLGFTGREGTLEKRLKGKNQPAWCCSSAAPSWWKTNKAPQGAQENSWISRSCYQHFAGNHLAADLSHFKGIPWSCTVPIESKIYFPCVSVNMGIKRDNCGTKRKWGSLLWHSGALCRAQPMLTEPQSAQQDYPYALLPFCHQLFHLCCRTHHWAGRDYQQILLCCGDKTFSRKN